MLVRHRHQFPVELLDDQAHQEVRSGIFLRHHNKQGCLLGAEFFRVHRAAETQYLFQLRIQEGIEPAHGSGKDAHHGLFTGVHCGSCHPSGFVFRRQLFHQQLKLVFPFHLAGGQQILQEFEYRHDMLLLWREEFGNQQDHTCQQPFRRVVKVRILAIVAFPARLDDGLGGNFCVLLHLCPGPEVVRIVLYLRGILGNQVQHIGPI